MLLLLDQHEAQWDSIVSEHVLANHQQVRDAHTVCWRLHSRLGGYMSFPVAGQLHQGQYL